MIQAPSAIQKQNPLGLTNKRATLVGGMMRIVLGSVGGGRVEGMDRLVEEYVGRAGRYAPTEAMVYRSEAALLEAAGAGRGAAWVVLLDGRGEMLTSEEFAGALGRRRDEGVQRVMVGVGPADGWSPGARERAGLVLSFGRATLPHGLARVVAAEQVYRALTILAGHPYHLGH